MAAAPRGSGATRVLFCHGLESGPSGFKVQELRRQGLDVLSPDMHMSLWNVFARNGLPRSLLSPSALLSRRPSEWLPGALQDSFASCVDVHRAALLGPGAAASDGPDGPPDVLVGSSWGGAVACALVADGVWRGPAVLLCPALRARERRGGGPPPDAAWSADAITARLAALPEPRRRAQMVLVHGSADETVPLADSVALSEATGIPLEVVDGGTHGLSAIVKDGRLARLIRRVCGGAAPGAEHDGPAGLTAGLGVET